MLTALGTKAVASVPKSGDQQPARIHRSPACVDPVRLFH